MSERYSKLFSLPVNLYATGSPVVIAAGALLKDNQTGKVLAQIKLRNISPKVIKAATVAIYPKDTVGNALGDAVQHQYLDLSEKRDAEFAQKQPIILPDPATRAFSVEVKEVIFTDNSLWTGTAEPWEVLTEPAMLATKIVDHELQKQYRIRYGKNSEFLYRKEKDIWYCSCGALNHEREEMCHICHNTVSDIAKVNWEELRVAQSLRLEDEKVRAAEVQAAAEIKIKKVRKLVLLIVPIVVLLIGLIAFLIYNAQMAEWNEITVGSTVTFGTYEQDNNVSNGKEDIEWLVLSKDEDHALLVSKYILDSRPYHDVDKGITWEECDLRKWLNTSFWANSFTREEKEKIEISYLENSDNPDGTEGGNSTADSVFLLSVDDVKKYSLGEAEGTAYAEANRLRVGDNGNAVYWLRSPGSEARRAAFMNSQGLLLEGGALVYDVGQHPPYYGNPVFSYEIGIRPAIWITRK